MMNQLHPDVHFHYEAIRSLGAVRYRGGDVGEQLNILPNIKSNDPESWYKEWRALAERVLESASDTQAYTGKPSAVTLRDAYFRASHYFFMSDFYLHHDWEDKRLEELWTLWRKYFDTANALLPNPGQHVDVPTPHGFHVPIIIYTAPGASGPRPTLIVAGGFDSNYEECLHAFGFATLERGYNLILYEGPGQPSVLHTQNQGFIHDWEKAVTPIVDYVAAEQQKGNLGFIDFQKIGLLGMSMGGYLAARAAAFEPRLAALVCIDGVWDFFSCARKFHPEATAAFDKGDREACNKAFEQNYDADTGGRWWHDHLLYSFRKHTAYEAYEEASKMTLAGGVAEKITMPAFIGWAHDDLFFGPEPQQVKDALGEKAYLHNFTRRDAASLHCSSGALTYMDGKILDWFGKVVGA